MKDRGKKYRCGDFSIVPMFKQISIETVNMCNNDCSFCSVYIHNDVRIHTKMDEGLFEKIINELSFINFDGLISLFSNNEPLIDNRIVAFAKKTRETVPNAKISIYTNGILLTEDIFNELVKCVDYLQIDNYSDDMKIQKHLDFVINACNSDAEINKKVNICVRKKNQVRSSRGGNAPNKKGIKTVKSKCICPCR